MLCVKDLFCIIFACSHHPRLLPSRVTENIGSDDDVNDVLLRCAKMPKAEPAEFAEVFSLNDSERTFSSMYLDTIYKDTMKTTHLALAILAPSGVCTWTTENLFFKVENDGWELSITASWPKFLLNSDRLHYFWAHNPNNSTAHDRDLFKRMEAFSDKLATMRESEREILTSVFRIALPVQVAKKIHFIQLLGEHEDESRVIYVDLKAEDSTYKVMESSTVQFEDNCEVKKEETES